MQDCRETGTIPVRLAVAMAVLSVVLGVLPFLKGALILGKHEGDALQLADMVFRIAEKGLLPHLDFMTPLGILSVLPIAVFVKAGLGFGMAFAAAQATLAVLLFLPILRVATSRFAGWTAWAYAALVLIEILALVHGTSDAAISLSMSYNRWAWALSFIALPLAMLEPKGHARPWLDGALIGLSFAALALLKATYAVAFFPPVLLILIARRGKVMILAATLSGLAVLAVTTALLGTGYWVAYLRDLIDVAQSVTRAAPGLPLAGIVGAPAYLGGSWVLMATVIFLRQAGRLTEGLALLLLAPSFFYVTYQNYGNDPQWLMLLGLFAFLLRPEQGLANRFGWPLRQLLLVNGVAALAFILPSVLNMAWSPLRLFADHATEQVPLLPRMGPRGSDVLVAAPRAYKVVVTQGWDDPGEPYETFADRYEDPSRATGSEGEPLEKPIEINGEKLPGCESQGGFNAWFEKAADDLMQAGYAGKRIVTADLYSALWMYGDFPPVEGAAPWYYSGTPGMENADYLLVPLCPNILQSRNVLVNTALGRGWKLDQVMRNQAFILFGLTAPRGGSDAPTAQASATISR